MGSCSTRPSRPPDVGEHEQHAPMWVVKVQYVLKMTEQLQVHQALKAQGLLELRRYSMFTMFVSHQWLGFGHPDPDGERLKALQTVLKNLIAKRVRIQHDLASQFYASKLSARQLDGVQDWYVWLDYFCVPQLVQGQQTQQTPGFAEEQLLYVRSIPSYVDLCNVFVALTPRTVHSDTHVLCDTHSWLQRGWCRTELWCYHLSTRSKPPIVEVKAPDALKFTAPVWHRYQVHSGDFAVEMDRTCCSRIVELAFTKHVANLRPTNKIAYRLYLSLFEEMTGLPRTRRSLDDFVSEFEFTKPLQQYKGLGPVACAALSGDEDLVRRVVIARANINTRAPAMPETLNCPDHTPLHLTLWFTNHNLLVLEALLEQRADPNHSTINTCPPLGLCRSPEAVDLLVHNGAGIHFQGKLVSQFCPIHVPSFFCAPPEVTARLLQLRAELHGGRGGLASSSPLHCIAYSGDSKNDLRNAQLLVESRADVNQVVKPEGVFRMLELMGRAYSCCRSETNVVVSWFSQLSTTPLGWCVILENHGLLHFLLHAQADPEIRGNTGLRPIDIARSETIRTILEYPNPHIYLLEHSSDLVTESL